MKICGKLFEVMCFDFEFKLNMDLNFKLLKGKGKTDFNYKN